MLRKARSQRVGSRLAGVVLGGLAAAAAPAPAGATSGTVTLDAPDAVVERPSAGSVTLVFGGTLYVDSSYSTAIPLVTYPYLESNSIDRLDATYHPDVLTWLVASGATGGLYQGPLFTVTVDASDPLGLYDHVYAGASTASYFYVYFNSSGAQSTNRAAYSVQVVPEPGTGALVAAALAGFAASRRRVGRR